jgi:hypothetical protein
VPQANCISTRARGGGRSLWSDSDSGARRAQSIAASGRHEVGWKLYVEHKLKPPVRFYETKRHPNKASALKRALAIYRNPLWRLNVLFIEGSNGERMEAAEISDWCERAPPDE